MVEVQELVELVFIIAAQTIQSLSLTHTYQFSTFPLSHCFSIPYFIPLTLSFMHATTHVNLQSWLIQRQTDPSQI